MLLDPPEMTIPPASSGMLAIPFMPSAMGRFAALLEATVQLPARPAAQGAAKPEAAGAAAAAKLQICKLMGEAGLPSLSIELPKGFEEPGQASSVRFSKLLKVCHAACLQVMTKICTCATRFVGRLPIRLAEASGPCPANSTALSCSHEKPWTMSMQMSSIPVIDGSVHLRVLIECLMYLEATLTRRFIFMNALQGKTQMLQVKLSNMGRLPSSFKVKAEPHAAFKLDLADVSAASTSALQTLQPGSDTVLKLTFSPPDAASYSHEVTICRRGYHGRCSVGHKIVGE